MKAASLPIQYILRNEQLTEACNVLNNSTEVAVDLEFDKNRYRYGFNLCLIQIATHEHCYIIDPLKKGLDISGLFAVLENPSIQKVTFAFNEDLRLLHSLGCFPKNVFDISVASKLMNYPPASLKNILADVLDIDISKAAQTSNWFKRPLTDGQIQYAAQDVLFLFQLKEALLKSTVDPIIYEWIEQENKSIEFISYADEQNSTPYKEKDKSGLTQFEWYLYKNHLLLREEWAASYNKPSYQVIDKNFLRETARDVAGGRSWTKKWGIFKPFNTSKNKDSLKKSVQQFRKEAESQGLSKTNKEIRGQTREEIQAFREERNRKEDIKTSLFGPIKQLITERYGEHTSTFMLSNKLILKIIDGHTEELLDYRKDLILDLAEELNIDLESFFATV